MRYIRFIAAFIAIFAATSCFVDDFEHVEVPSESRDEITVVARVARFDDREVDTRGTKNEDEANVTCMAVAIFPIVDGAIGDCVFYDFREGSQLLFTIDRQEIKNGAYIYNVDKPYVMYVFANLPAMTEDACAKMTLDQMKAMAYSVENVDIPQKGFPMIGSLGDAIDTNDDKKGDTTITPEGDGKTFILKPGNALNPTLPLVNGEETDLLNVPMKALFSKVNFTIKVTPDQTVDTHLTPQFTLDSYTVNNVPASVDFAMGGKPRLNHSITDNVTSVVGPFENPMPLLNGTTIARGTQTINFTIYLPERFLTPTYQSHDGSMHGQDDYYNYPFPVVEGKYRAEDLDLRQRFKPELPKGQAATYVTINGTFRDHQQHEFIVSYDIYLGEDNYGNFDTERNCEYFHYITIRGILNSDEQLHEPGKEISIDHRVNVTRVEPIIVNLRRETQLDSHFEVRPLRIRKNPDYKGDLSNAKVKIEVVYDKTPDQKWVGLERSFGNGAKSGDAIYLNDGDLAADRKNSLGKRKYFTTDLTYNTLAGESQKDANGYSIKGGQSVIVPITEDDEAVWIYVDEAPIDEAADAMRKATIRISIAEDGTNYDTPIDYVIQQHQLFPVTHGDNTYLIEYVEEYLHNFDAEDSYGQTKQKGMPWGLDGVQLSNKYTSFDTDKAGTDWKSDYTSKYPLPYYDFYIGKHDDDNENSDEYTKDGGTLHNYAGQLFTEEIYKATKNDSDVNKKVNVLTMADQPKGAVEYCYNRNKRQSDGSVAEEDLVWYLPSADELEDFIIEGYSTFKEFQDNYYWTSQPAYIRNVFYYEYDRLIGSDDTYAFTIYEDNKEYARATKVVYDNGKYDYVPSGLDPIAYKADGTQVDNRAKRNEGNSTIFGYFYVMRYWKRDKWGGKDYGQDKRGIADAIKNGIDVTTGDYDEVFKDTKDEKRYYFHLGHLYNMVQKKDVNGKTETGYLLRTESHRVRCVRKQ
ncbi:MAG: DUF4906 domain-containing protein [Alistipes sp.]|nr:DUF4906 domain-containing protein [Alistipes sp.]